MKLLITGAHGMAGQSLTQKLKQLNDIRLLTPTKQALNLLDQQAINHYLRAEQPEMIIHLAARVGGIQANIANPVAFLTDNILINTHLLTGALSHKIKNLLFIGSSCMYPKDREILSESDMLTGLLEPTNEGYALAKISGASLCKYINLQYGFAYKTIIPCNLYGPYDNFHPTQSHLIPGLIRKLHEARQMNKNEVVIWGNGDARREFMYVDDLTNFIMLAIQRINVLPQSINVGLGYDYTIKEYYQMAAKIIGFQGEFVYDKNQPTGMQKKLLNISLAKNLGWQAQSSLEYGLKKTYDYFLSLPTC
ncbi:MAG: hypothetical protein A3F43_02535 [Gammaproteobacteria bacterium RIFCSPHIGHO2_12_FULL_42_10]|nr:MAG: hypothetical protein A3F43_02535 [Gammaproteobacteria bacterium RIFCSPHIGHO2_12_FULL_42_10]